MHDRGQLATGFVVIINMDRPLPPPVPPPPPASSGPGRPRSRASVQFEMDRPCSPSTCRVSDCWSPTSDLDPCGRPLGGLEKVIEYRTVPNGQSIELRRLTASSEGPVEHIQVPMCAYCLNHTFFDKSY